MLTFAVNRLSGRLARGLVGLLAAAALCVACSDGQISPSGGSDASAVLIRGGTLKVVGSSDVDHLATVSGYITGSMWLSRTFARQLVTYPPASDFESAIALAPDVARD